MQSESTNKSQKNNKQRILIVCFVAFFLLGIYFLIGKPMIAFVGDTDGFQEYVKSRGIFGLLVFGFFVFFTDTLKLHTRTSVLSCCWRCTWRH